MDLLQWFEKGLTSKEYIDSMQRHKENLQKVYTSFQLSETHREVLSTVPTAGIKVIVLTEDWCGDAMVNIPILLRIAEETNIDVRFILRDCNLELMDQYLTNGTARSIPIFIFIDEAGNELAVWGPRAAIVQQRFEELKAQLPSESASDYKEKQQSLIAQLIDQYTNDAAMWQIIAESLIEKFTAMK